MKTLFRNHWIELQVIKGLVFGAAVNDNELVILVGPLTVCIRTWIFTKRNRKRRPNEL